MQKIIGMAPGLTNSIVAMMPGNLIVVLQFISAEQLALAVLCSSDPKTAFFDGINS
jgi:hypothetical protein